MDLIEEYRAELRAGKKPKISKYMAMYEGPGREEFEMHLRMTAILTTDGIRRRKGQERGADEKQRNWQRQICQKILSKKQ